MVARLDCQSYQFCFIPDCGLDGQTFRRHQDHLRPRRGDGASGTNQSVAELPVDDSTMEAIPTKSSSSEESLSLVSDSVHDTSEKHRIQPCHQVIAYKHRNPLCHWVSALQYRAQVYHQFSVIHREIGRPLTVTVLDSLH